MTFTIDIPDDWLREEVTKLVTQRLADEVFDRTLGGYNRNVFQGIAKQAVNDLLSSRADEIVDRCIPQAASYIGRKGVAKFVDKMEKGEV